VIRSAPRTKASDFDPTTFLRFISAMNSGFRLAVVEGFLSYRRPLILVIHVLLVTAAYFLAFLLRFEFRIPPDQWEIFFTTFPVLILARVVVFAWFHLYEGMWRYVSMYDIKSILKAVTLSSLLFMIVALGVFANGYPRSVLALDWVFCLALVGGVRLGIRALRESAGRQSLVIGKRALVVGGGDAGEMLMREMGRNPTLNYEVVGFVDDDPRKQQRRIHGIEVVGTVDQLPALSQSRKVQEILIAVPSATGEQ
jgi:FlaA1/EpsC-like NDP-sugar epimerase